MERKIYYSLATISTITVILTSVVLGLLFFDVNKTESIINSKNLGFMFLTILPALIGLIVFILIFIYIISYYITSKIIEPIKVATENIEGILSGEEIKEGYIYDELKPFIKTIDIQRKEMELSLIKLKEAEKIRREFTANVSHELKTPLTSINGFAEMISSGMTKEEETIKFANIIHKEGARLLALIDSIINLSHIEEKSLESDYETLDVYEIIETILSQLSYRASDKNIKLNISVEHYEFRGNRRMIEELIINLVDNGIKYNHENGSVDVIIRKKDNSLSIRVKDTGIGIPIKDQNRVFERFFMVDKSRSKKVQGTGLGLSIVKHIVEYHGGTISLKSEVNKGTEIEVLLPI